MNQQQELFDVYAHLSSIIMEQLKSNVVPWKQSWTTAGIPQNLVSRDPYKGVNMWLLASLGYDHNVFATSREIKVLGGSIKSGERAKDDEHLR